MAAVLGFPLSGSDQYVERSESVTPPRLIGLRLTTAATLFSGAVAAWLLGTSRQARVIEIASLCAGMLGNWIAWKLRNRQASVLAMLGFLLFWLLTVIITMCWILLAVTWGSPVSDP